MNPAGKDRLPRGTTWFGSAVQCVLCAASCFAATDPSASARLEPERQYYGANRSVPILIHAPEDGPPPELRLVDPKTELDVSRAVAAVGLVDIASLFPVLWSASEPGVLYLQLAIGDEAVGAPLVLRPLLPPARTTDRFTEMLFAAAAKGGDSLNALLKLKEPERLRLRRGAGATSRPVGGSAGLSIIPLRHLVLETSAGVIEIVLRHDAAPNTCEHIARLAEGGLFTEIPFHRVVAEGAGGRPFIIQSGDPAGTGEGGPGFAIDFESSPLPHDFGVVSLARQPEDPNSGGSQFMICLSREACAPLDGQYTSFGQVVGGADVVRTIAASPVGPREPGKPTSPRDRPLRPVVIRSARLVDAPPVDSAPPPTKESDLKPVER